MRESLEVIYFITMGISKVDLAIKGLVKTYPVRAELNLITEGTRLMFPSTTLYWQLNVKLEVSLFLTMKSIFVVFYLGIVAITWKQREQVC